MEGSSSVFSLPLALSLVLAAAWLSSASTGAGAGAGAAFVPSPSTDFVRRSCKVTRYPGVCEHSLLGYAAAVRHSPRRLANAALTVSADRARSASTFVARLSPAPRPVRSRGFGAVRDCLETMRDSVDRLRDSVREMSHMGRAGSPRFAWHLSNVQTWVSGALTDENTCLDSLSHNAGPDVRAALRSKVVDVAQVTSNALALVNLLGPHP